MDTCDTIMRTAITRSPPLMTHRFDIDPEITAPCPLV
jgi:hypothetical protein